MSLTWMVRSGVAAAAVLAWAVPARARLEAGGDDEKAHVKLIAEREALVAGETNWLGVQYDLEPGWHIYWNGENDTGAPPTVTPKLPAGWTAGEMLWPAPIRHVGDGDLLDHIYEKRVVLLLPVKAPADAKPGSKVTLAVASEWMVCKSACMLGSGESSLTLPVVEAGKQPAKGADARLIDASRDRVPKAPPADGIASAWKGSTLVITSKQGKKLAFYPNAGTAKPVNLLKGGATDKGRLELSFEKPAHVQGIVEVTPEGGSERVRSMMWLIDIAPPPEGSSNKAGDGASNPGKSP
jgi:thiol:disulfide interchange protein DsbD